MITDIQHFLDLYKIPSEEIKNIIDKAIALKQEFKETGSHANKPFTGKHLGMLFEKHSMRTRVSFQVGFNQLGGDVVILNKSEIHWDDPETVEDIGMVLSRYLDMIMIRCYSHRALKRLASSSNVPVINGLTDWTHPCQVMAEIMTIQEKFGDIEGKNIVWVGDCDNVLRSWAHAAGKLDFTLKIAAPKQWQVEDEVLKPALQDGAKIEIHYDAKEAVRDADVVVTDTWLSMGDFNLTKEEKEDKLISLKPYQVNAELMKASGKDSTIFMHCLPAERGSEVTAEVLDGKQSVVFDEAENRLHVQKAIMLWLIGEC